MRLREVSRSELVEQYILENIVAARNPGDRIPSEAALSKEFGVAVPTVNKILASLTDRGILFRKKGLGTYVAEQSPKGKVVRVITQSAKKYIPGSTVNWFNYQYVLEGFSRTAREYGIITETFFFDHYRPVNRETLDELLTPGAEGYLYHPVLESDWTWAEELGKAGKIVLARSYKPSPLCHTVCSGLKAPYMEALSYLKKQGRRHLLFFHEPVHATGYAEEHWKDFHDAAADAGLEFAPEYHKECGLLEKDGYTAMKEVLQSGLPVDAVIGGTDSRTFGIMHALQEAGKRIPEDIAVIGADDLPQCTDQLPPLATITYPMYEIGAELCRIFVQALKENNRRIINSEINRKFIWRESAGTEDFTPGT